MPVDQDVQGLRQNERAAAQLGSPIADKARCRSRADAHMRADRDQAARVQVAGGMLHLHLWGVRLHINQAEIDATYLQKVVLEYRRVI